MLSARKEVEEICSLVSSATHFMGLVLELSCRVSARG